MNKNTKVLIVALVLMMAIFALYNFDQTSTQTENSSEVVEGSTKVVSQNTGPRDILASELSEYSTKENCWTVVDNRVYYISNWLNSEPDNVEDHNDFCGTDSTDFFTANLSEGVELSLPFAENFVGDFIEPAIPE